MEMLTPASLSPMLALVLVITAGFTSFLSAAMGIGGGLLLLIIMANVMPIAALIPVHGLIQLGSNANRAVMTRAHVQWDIWRYFVFGALGAAVLASLVLVQLPASVLQIGIGVFVLLLTWGITPKKRELSKFARGLVGFITTFLSMFVGATGPLVAALIHAQRADRHQLVATFSACMTVQHGLKLIVFIALGFAFTPWLALVSLMIAAGWLGTWLGLKMLNRFSQEKFAFWFKLVLTGLALRSLYQGGMALF